MDSPITIEDPRISDKPSRLSSVNWHKDFEQELPIIDLNLIDEYVLISKAISPTTLNSLGNIWFTVEIKKLDDYLSQNILNFCLQHGILRYLSIAIDLIEACFSSIKETHLQLEQDPETDEEWLMINVTVQGEVDGFLDNYDNYTTRWVSLVPWPERYKIRLSYNII